MLNMTSSLFKHHCSGKGSTTCGDMNHRSSCKIQGPHLGKYAIGMPAPVRQWRIDQKRKKHYEQDIRSKTNPFCNCTHNKTRSNDREHQLK